jgi:hypothetical protein
VLVGSPASAKRTRGGPRTGPKPREFQTRLRSYRGLIRLVNVSSHGFSVRIDLSICSPSREEQSDENRHLGCLGTINFDSGRELYGRCRNISITLTTPTPGEEKLGFGIAKAAIALKGWAWAISPRI